jgi:hypothetical protein
MSSCNCASNSLNEARHILQLSCGLTVTLVIDEATGAISCQWSDFPTEAMLPAVSKEYVAWRNKIVEAWAKRNGKRVLLVDL